MRLLVVEDDVDLAAALQAGLQRAGFGVDVFHTGEAGDTALRTTAYDLALLDIGLPATSGLAVLRGLRHRQLQVPVILLTARDTLQDRLDGFAQGADDYLVKPFEMAELVARCQALIRRSHAAVHSVLSFGGLTLDIGQHLALRADGSALGLTTREWELLRLLTLAAPNVVPKQKLVDSLSSWDRGITANAVEIMVSRVRPKLQGAGVALRSIRGLGYRLEIETADVGSRPAVDAPPLQHG